ncbi:MAG: Hsp20/alpha crystallin family protein [Patescibacteria group bacterium]|jgi:HSP20 family protein|nr:Hsp20/alpha crystallin family protein [Patescibacteria group bacterium]
MMTKNNDNNPVPVTEESFFLEDNTFNNDWMGSMMEDTVSNIEGELAVDVYETAKEMVVKAPVAGIDPENLDITLTEEMVMIKGERKEVREVDKSSYRLQECYWGSFSRTIDLPTKVLPDEANADFKNGILTIRIPKAVVNKIKKLKINI